MRFRLLHMEDMRGLSSCCWRKAPTLMRRAECVCNALQAALYRYLKWTLILIHKTASSAMHVRLL